MGWAHGTNLKDREVGYGVEATCDEPGCEAEIDRGVAFVCGGEHDGGEDGCGGYFCASHLFHAMPPDGRRQLCNACFGAVERDTETDQP